jgi:hypothetical protein
MISTKPALENAHHSIRDNFDQDSSATEESDLHSEKRLSPNTSIDAGRMMSTKSVPKNAPASIRDNFNQDSNVREESDMHQQEQLSPKTSTDAE